MAEHRNLTGDSLHEPKGVEDAGAGQVYVADGAGSGEWANPLAAAVEINKFYGNTQIPDISTEYSTAYYVVPRKASLFKVSGALGATVSSTSSLVSIYKNNVFQSASLTVPPGAPGSKTLQVLSPAISVDEGDLIELRSDGGGAGTATFSATLSFTSVA